MSAKKLVLENSKGEVVRQLYWHGEAFSVVYRKDTHKVDFVKDIKALEKDGVRFDVLKTVKAASAFSRPFELSNGSKIKVLSNIEKVQAAPTFPEDKKEDVQKAFKWTAIVQMSTIAVVMIVGLIIEPWLFKAPEEPIVTVIQQQEIPPPPKPEMKKPTPTVKMANKPIVRKVVKPVVKRRGPVTKMSKEIRLDKVGAIGALGGIKTGSTQSAGFNPNSFTNSRGTSTTASGNTGTGSKYAGQGAGLFQAAKGGSEGISGAGGYSTKGKAGGGRPGYGAMNTGGSASRYFQPVDEEALVDGGLDRDQIAAVINRHLGQIIYCYEKGLQVNAKLNGRVGVNFTIGPQGIVKTASTATSSLNSPTVESCIVSKLKTWVFPKPVGGVNVKVTYPFVLRRVNQG